MNKIWQLPLFAGDIIWLILSLFITYAIRLYVTHEEFQFIELIIPFSILFAIWIVIFFIFNLYEAESVNPNPKNIGKVILAMFMNFIIGLLFFYIFSSFGLAPKLSLVSVSIISFVFLIIWRRFFYTISRPTFAKFVILVGNQKALEEFREKMKSHPYIRESMTLSENADIENEIESYAKKGQCLVIVNDYALLQKIMPLAEKYDCKIITLMSAYENILGRVPTDLLTDEEAIDMASRKENLLYKIIYGIFEKICALSILIIASPILILAMIAIIIESGAPVIYKQERVGKHGRIFKFYKLRSMIKNAETTGAEWAKEKDSRVTSIGNILRKTHIDEIPQMWNVLVGDLALIGPRPERPEFVEQLTRSIPYYNVRQVIKPGFTGWAQIKFGYARSVDDSKEKFEYDLYYIKNRSLLLDLGILLKTIQIIVTHL